jgi:hypothetical protein
VAAQDYQDGTGNDAASESDLRQGCDGADNVTKAPESGKMGHSAAPCVYVGNT